MPFNLHPSGFCSWSSDHSKVNLIPGRACPVCNRIAGHASFITNKKSTYFEKPCPFFKMELKQATSSRGKLFDAVSVLWAQNANKSFITFTLPSLENGTYQKSPTCNKTGDLVIGKMFSKTLEAWTTKEKRKSGDKLSYVWVSEAQQKRQEKFGGCGDIHYHLIVNRKFKNDYKGSNGKFNFVSQDAFDQFQWLQSNWCNQVGAKANNAVHVDPLPDYARSIPAYMSKYMGKGQDRAIVSRRFQATQDLTKFKTIQLTSLPEEITLINEKVFTTPDGFDIFTRYFNTREVLEMYGHQMVDQSNYTASRGNGRSLTKHARSLDRIGAKFNYSAV